MKLAVIILNYNDYKTTKCLLDVITKYKCIDHIVVVDNKSTEDDYLKLKTYEKENVIVLQSGKNAGYSYGNNCGAKWIIDNTKDEIIVFTNSDVYFDEQFILKLKQDFEIKKDYSIITGLQVDRNGKNAPHPFWPCHTIKLYFLNRLFQLRFGRKIIKDSPDYSYSVSKINNDEIFIEVGAVEGCLFGIRRDDFITINYFDESIFIYFEEDILAKKINRINKKVGVDKSIKFIHYGCQTTNKVFTNSTKINHTYNSALYYFNNYQTKNIVLNLFNFILCNLIRIDNSIVFLKRKIRNKIV